MGRHMPWPTIGLSLGLDTLPLLGRQFTVLVHDNIS